MENNITPYLCFITHKVYILQNLYSKKEVNFYLKYLLIQSKFDQLSN